MSQYRPEANLPGCKLMVYCIDYSGREQRIQLTDTLNRFELEAGISRYSAATGACSALLHPSQRAALLNGVGEITFYMSFDASGASPQLYRTTVQANGSLG
jgi:hypothetical protein